MFGVFGAFNFGTNVNKTVHETTNQTVSSFVKNNVSKTSLVIGCEQEMNFGNLRCSGGVIEQQCGMTVDMYQKLDDSTVVTMMSQLSSNIMDNITQAASKEVGGLVGLLSQAIPSVSVETNVNDTRDAVTNTLTSDTTVKNVQSISTRLFGKQKMNFGDIDCGGGPMPTITQTFLADMFSQQVANVVTTALTQNQTYNQMVTNVSQTVKNVASGGIIILIVILVIVVLIIKTASKHANKLNKKNIAALAKTMK